MNIQIIEVNNIEHVVIDKGDGHFTSMAKAYYEEQYGPIEGLE